MDRLLDNMGAGDSWGLEGIERKLEVMVKTPISCTYCTLAIFPLRINLRLHVHCVWRGAWEGIIGTQDTAARLEDII